jgi:hypothetical protein
MAAAAQAVPPLTESKMDEARRLEVAGGGAARASGVSVRWNPLAELGS